MWFLNTTGQGLTGCLVIVQLQTPGLPEPWQGMTMLQMIIKMIMIMRTVINYQYSLQRPLIGILRLFLF